jgi:hypothetical protein
MQRIDFHLGHGVLPHSRACGARVAPLGGVRERRQGALVAKGKPDESEAGPFTTLVNTLLMNVSSGSMNGH